MSFMKEFAGVKYQKTEPYSINETAHDLQALTARERAR